MYPSSLVLFFAKLDESNFLFVVPKKKSFVFLISRDNLLDTIHNSLMSSNFMLIVLNTFTTKNTVISPNFLMWTFCRQTQFPNSFRPIAVFEDRHFQVRLSHKVFSLRSKNVPPLMSNIRKFRRHKLLRINKSYKFCENKLLRGTTVQDIKTKKI